MPGSPPLPQREGGKAAHQFRPKFKPPPKKNGKKNLKKTFLADQKTPQPRVLPDLYRKKASGETTATTHPQILPSPNLIIRGFENRQTPNFNSPTSKVPGVDEDSSSKR
ncbi:hypothetical protein TNIN_233611 [Trichonephila inaurata madagascariensis]|uniref:Uncharacterized protein n=1 Tax=Trichonephila inaurata madagascariensis TaxID=2747483 RepID=A0A8X7BPR6_9ARAC|nr:hypothetical protein TNIN_233611 [Trichonephila inaurata madagascariensis]